MGVMSKFINRFNFSDAEANDEDYFIDGDYDGGDYEDEEEQQSSSLFSRRGGSQSQQSSRSGGFLGRKVVPIDGAHEMEVTMIKPSQMEDSRDICDYLLAGKAVVMNMEGINTEMAQRIIDFTLGAVYSMDGDIKMISRFIFIATPRNVELSGEFQSSLGSFSDRAPKTAAQQTQRFGGLNFGT